MTRKPLSSLLLLSLAISLSGSLAAQIKYDTIHLGFNRRRPMIGALPYNRVEVLDNRIDTGFVYRVENGELPMHVLVFAQPASIAIQQYLQNGLEQVSSGTGTLVLNLRQLRSTNKDIRVSRRGKRYGRRLYSLHNNILLEAEVYDKKGDDFYYPLVKIKGIYSGSFGIAYSISAIMDDVLRAAANRSGGSSNTISYEYPKPSVVKLWSQINVNERKRWADFPVMKVAEPASGIFLTFDDFRDNKPRKNTFDAGFRSRDSVYILSRKHRRGHHIVYPWGFADQGLMYVRLYANVYVRARMYDNTWHFYVPHGTPDMYSMLSIETGAANGNLGSGNAITGNVNVASVFAAFTILVLADAVIAATDVHRIRKLGLRSEFRYCYLDMDTGDVIYSNQPEDAPPALP